MNIIDLLKTAETGEKEKTEAENVEESDCDALILVTALVTSCVRYGAFSAFCI